MKHSLAAAYATKRRSKMRHEDTPAERAMEVEAEAMPERYMTEIHDDLLSNDESNEIGVEEAMADDSLDNITAVEVPTVAEIVKKIRMRHMGK